MRTASLIVIALLLASSGCATRWTVFGHSMGRPSPVDQALAGDNGPPQPAAQMSPDRAAPSPAPIAAPVVAQSPEAAGPLLLAPQSHGSALAPFARHGQQNIQAIKVTFTPAAKEKLAAEPQFTEDGLHAAIEAELRTQRLLDDSGPGLGATLEIVIDDFAVRATTNAVLFGYVLSAGTLKGDLNVRAPDGTALHNSRIQARSSLTKSAGSQHGASFEPLYKGFADLTARNLSGAAEPVAVNH